MAKSHAKSRPSASSSRKPATERPPLTVETWALDSLIPYARNPRKHTDASVGKLAGLLKEFGFKVPVLAKSDGEIVDGHLRVQAARKLGYTQVPVILCDDWTPAQVKAFRFASKKLVEWDPFDDELAKLELKDLEADEIDWNLTGLSEKELSKWLDETNEATPKEDTYTPVYELAIELKDESSQQQLYEELTARGYQCRVLNA